MALPPLDGIRKRHQDGREWADTAHSLAFKTWHEDVGLLLAEIDRLKAQPAPKPKSPPMKALNSIAHVLLDLGDFPEDWALTRVGIGHETDEWEWQLGHREANVYVTKGWFHFYLHTKQSSWRFPYEYRSMIARIWAEMRETADWAHRKALEEDLGKTVLLTRTGKANS